MKVKKKILKLYLPILNDIFHVLQPDFNQREQTSEKLVEQCKHSHAVHARSKTFRFKSNTL